MTAGRFNQGMAKWFHHDSFLSRCSDKAGTLLECLSCCEGGGRKNPQVKWSWVNLAVLLCLALLFCFFIPNPLPCLFWRAVCTGSRSPVAMVSIEDMPSSLSIVWKSPAVLLLLIWQMANGVEHVQVSRGSFVPTTWYHILSFQPESNLWHAFSCHISTNGQ